MRARNIKPGFFTNECVADCDPLARLLFQGLWCFADREGRFEWRPKKIKAEILPYDNCQIEKLLAQLQKHQLIISYSVNGNDYAFIPNFKKHQKPHPREAASTLPSPKGAKPGQDQGHAKDIARQSQDALILGYSDIRNPEPPPKYIVPPLGEFKNVNLKASEHQKLIKKFGQAKAHEWVEALSAFIEQIGKAKANKKYKSHYATILNWERRAKGAKPQSWIDRALKQN